MKVKLNKIKPSPNPIRKEWDEDKMAALVRSVKKRGLVVPPKMVKKNGTWVTVYGHRRVEAARQAGLKEIECIVESVSDKDAIGQSWIENMLREDMSAWDIAEALGKIADLEGVKSAGALERLGYGPESTLQLYWRLQEQPEEVKEAYKKPRPSARRKTATPAAGVRLTAPPIEVVSAVASAGLAEIKRGSRSRTKILTDDGVAVVKKAAEDRLTTEQASNVARAVAAAPTKTAKKKLLKRTYSEDVHDADLVRAKTAIDSEAKETKRVKENAWATWPEGKEIVKAIRAIHQSDVPSWKKSIAMGKLDPVSHCKPLIGQVDKAIGALKELRQQLEEV